MSFTDKQFSRRALAKRVGASTGTAALAAAVPALATASATPSAATPVARPIEKINHLIAIYQENWSFDSLYGRFPGANAGDAVTQVDKDGTPYETLPQPIDTSKKAAHAG